MGPGVDLVGRLGLDLLDRLCLDHGEQPLGAHTLGDAGGCRHRSGGDGCGHPPGTRRGNGHRLFVAGSSIGCTGTIAPQAAVSMTPSHHPGSRLGLLLLPALPVLLRLPAPAAQPVGGALLLFNFHRPAPSFSTSPPGSSCSTSAAGSSSSTSAAGSGCSAAAAGGFGPFHFSTGLAAGCFGLCRLFGGGGGAPSPRSPFPPGEARPASRLAPALPGSRAPSPSLRPIGAAGFLGVGGPHQRPRDTAVLPDSPEVDGMKITMMKGRKRTCSAYQRSKVLAVTSTPPSRRISPMPEDRNEPSHVRADRDRPERQLVPWEQVAGEDRSRVRSSRTTPTIQLNSRGRLVGAV